MLNICASFCVFLPSTSFLSSHMFNNVDGFRMSWFLNIDSFGFLIYLSWFCWKAPTFGQTTFSLCDMISDLSCHTNWDEPDGLWCPAPRSSESQSSKSYSDFGAAILWGCSFYRGKEMRVDHIDIYIQIDVIDVRQNRGAVHYMAWFPYSM